MLLLLLVLLEDSDASRFVMEGFRVSAGWLPSLPLELLVGGARVAAEGILLSRRLGLAHRRGAVADDGASDAVAGLG